VPQIDREYISLLDPQRRDAISAEFAKNRTNSSARISKESVNLPDQLFDMHAGFGDDRPKDR
jgi:hypothetical protein